MPGICGIAWMRRERGAGTVEAMARRLAAGRARRVRLVVGRGAAFARCGIDGAILQTEPFTSREGRILCAVDGWIDGDWGGGWAERIIEMYRRQGIAALCGLRGQYAIALWDGVERTLHLVTDRLGTRNVYWTIVAGDFIFTSELRSLRSVAGLRLRGDDEGLAEYLTLGYALEDRTILEGVRLVMPGSVLTFSGGGVRVARWWTADMGEDRPARTLGNCVAELSARLDVAVGRHMVAGGAFGLGLSGGRDSRLLAGVLAEQGQACCRAYTFGDEGARGEARVGGLVAEAVGMRHERVRIGSEGLADRMEECAWISDGGINTCEFRSLAEASAERDEALFWGFGGDVLSGAPLHPSFYGARSREELCGLQFRADKWEMMGAADAAAVFHGEFYARVRGVVEDNYRRAFRDLECEALPNLWMLHELRQRQRRRTLRVMSISEAYLPSLYPYADDDVLEFLLAQPVEYKRYRKTYAELLNRRFPGLADIAHPGHRISMRWETRLFRAIQLGRRLRDCWTDADCGPARGVDRLYAEALCGPLAEKSRAALGALAREYALIAPNYADALLRPARIMQGGYYRVLKLMTLSRFLSQLLRDEAPAPPEDVVVVESGGDDERCRGVQ